MHLGQYQGAWLWVVQGVCLIWKETAQLTSKVTVLFYIPTSSQ